MQIFIYILNFFAHSFSLHFLRDKGKASFTRNAIFALPILCRRGTCGWNILFFNGFFCVWSFTFEKKTIDYIILKTTPSSSRERWDIDIKRERMKEGIMKECNFKSYFYLQVCITGYKYKGSYIFVSIFIIWQMLPIHGLGKGSDSVAQQVLFFSFPDFLSIRLWSMFFWYGWEKKLTSFFPFFPLMD